MMFTDYLTSRLPLNDSLRLTKQLILRELPPAGFTREVIENIFRKALRLKIWRTLKPEARALILALRKWTGKIKSPTLKAVLEEIYVEIELNTVRGKALLYGVKIALRDGMLEYLVSTQKIFSSVRKLVCLGISYLSNPPLYRCLG